MAQKPEFQVFLNQFHLGRKTELQTHQISSKVFTFMYELYPIKNWA